MNKKLGLMAWLIYALVINVLMFLIANHYTATFWVNFIFVMLALVTVLVFQYLVWRDGKTEAFFKISPIIVSYVYLFVQLPLGILFSWGEIVIPFKVVLIVHLIVMATAWIFIIGGYAGNEHSDKVNSRQKDHHKEL